MKIKSKVTATTVASAIGAYVLSLLEGKLGVSLDPALSALVIAVLTAVVKFAAGWLKREHVIDQATYDNFVGSSEDQAVTALAEKQVKPVEVKPAKHAAPTADSCVSCPLSGCADCPVKGS